MSKTIVGMFDNRQHAEIAASKVKEQGLRTDDISIVSKQGDEGDPTNTATGIAPAGTGTAGVTAMGMKNDNTPINDNISDGVVSGSVLGGIAGLVIGAGSLIVPGLGIIAAAGPIAGLISGAVTGGIVGGLVDLGIPENRSRQYESDIKHGKILFSMKTDEDKVDKISSILKSSGATSIETY
jgi:uncharacterized membrane protein